MRPLLDSVRHAAGMLAPWVLLAQYPALAQTVIAVDGRAALRIVVATDAIPAERTAARELAEHLERACGAHFEIVAEATPDAAPPAIFVGPTRFAERAAGAWSPGPEQWRIRTAEGSLVLDGGRPRGTLYAVYHFLEQFVGVRWWTPYDTDVPPRADLRLGAIDLAGQPAFGYRDVQGLDGPLEFSARSRHSGNESWLGPEYGERDRYGPPYHVHNFYLYLPPAEFFADHPEFYSEIDGRRTADRAQLCLSNAEVRRIVAERLVAYADRAQAEARARGETPPVLFAISQNDWDGRCRCPQCAAADRRARSAAGSLVEFINDVSDRIAGQHPELLIDTLAYHYTFTPPHGAKLRDRAVVRLAALQQRDFSKPVTHRRHRAYREAIDGWRAVTAHLRIWDYTTTFGRGEELPLPNLELVAQDFRYYREHGVEGVYTMHHASVRGDMRDLKVWVLLKLLEDPYRDVDALVREFTDGYYREAAESIRAYLDLLERALERRSPWIDYPALPEQYRHLTPRVLRQAQALFDAAEERVAYEPELVARVRRARLSLDRATLLRFSNALRRSGPGPALDPQAVARRYWSTAQDMIDVRLPAALRDDERRKVAREIVGVLLDLGYAPPEPPLPAAEPASHER